MSQLCFGLLIVFVCQGQQPATVSDFCQLAATEISKLQRLTDAEISALERPRKEAIVSLRRKHRELCK